MNITDWATRWNVPPGALAELQNEVFGLNRALDFAPANDATRVNETFTVAAVRSDAAQRGARLWRNNVGATADENGRFIRYGQANDSANVNKHVKSGDLIGVKPVMITPAHIGKTIGQFVSREVKAPGWKWRGSERELAQLRWAELVLSFGGDAAFCTGAGTL